MYLTFDDGPDPVYTPLVLDVLAAHGARATFFLQGSEIEKHPAVFQRILHDGHTVGNHSYGHEVLPGLSRAEFAATIGRTQELLGDQATPCLRPPHGRIDALTERWAAEHGLAVVLWHLDPGDWRETEPASAIARHILDHAFDGAVVVLHDGGGDRSATVAAIHTVLSQLTPQGFRFDPICHPLVRLG